MKFISACINHSLQPARQVGEYGSSPGMNVISSNESEEYKNTESYLVEKDHSSLDLNLPSSASDLSFNKADAVSKPVPSLNNSNDLPISTHFNNDSDDVSSDPMSLLSLDSGESGIESESEINSIEHQSIMSPISEDSGAGEGVDYQAIHKQANHMSPDVFLENSIAGNSQVNNNNVEIDRISQEESGVVENTKLIPQVLNENLPFNYDESPMASDDSVSNHHQVIAHKNNSTAETAASVEPEAGNNIDERHVLISESIHQEKSNHNDLISFYDALSQQEPISEEIPQVRIGQINVLIDDRSAIKSRRRESKTAEHSTNTFGLRGL